MPRTVCTIERIGRVALDLAAQPVDLHVDGALADRAADCRPAPCAARSRPASPAKIAQHLALAVGEVDRSRSPLLQFAAREWKTKGPKRTDSTGGAAAGCARLRMLAMRSDSSRGSNGFDEIVVGADLQPLDAALGLGARGQHQDRHARVGAQRLRASSKPVSPGIITSRIEQVEAQAASLARASAALSAVVTRKPFSAEEARQQIADAAVVVDHQQMRRVVGERGERVAACIIASSAASPGAVGARDQSQHAVAVLGIDHGGQEAPRRLVRAGPELAEARG